MDGVGAAVPFPVLETVEGLPVALCVTVRVAVFGPVPVGRKVTVTA